MSSLKYSIPFTEAAILHWKSKESDQCGSFFFEKFLLRSAVCNKDHYSELRKKIQNTTSHRIISRSIIKRFLHLIISLNYDK